MLNMQTFYTKLFSPKANKQPLFSGLAQISRSSLKQILAVRSDLSWDIWS